MKKAQRKQKPPTSRRRKNRQREKRIAGEALRAQLGRARKHLRADAPVIAIRRVQQGEIAIGIRRGLFGHPGTVLLRVDDASIVGCTEDNTELAKLVNNIGLLVAAQLFGHDLTKGVEGLGKSIATWAGIDLEALAKAAADDTDEVIGNERTCPSCKSGGFTPETIGEHVSLCATSVEVPSVDDITNETAPVL